MQTPFLNLEAEVGFGGGASIYIIESIPAQVDQYNKTGRGILKAPKRALSRFKSLKPSGKFTCRALL